MKSYHTFLQNVHIKWYIKSPSHSKNVKTNPQYCWLVKIITINFSPNNSVRMNGRLSLWKTEIKRIRLDEENMKKYRKRRQRIRPKNISSFREYYIVLQLRRYWASTVWLMKTWVSWFSLHLLWKTFPRKYLDKMIH